ncbi:pilus assembly protein TadG-related protein [Desulfovibrio sp. TomC]|uniref:pilus assembly protein TadG-related protein n=1 Tax=Desulfovibrio sp. TomC TaxID=1562888 RepID=UPI0005731FD3|nr:pilus assembly protein TadG-related protein [Desulfovibrio sp. TomC]KHK03366.1 Von Willebrand factor type A domain protein, associated with Flp pilus assembly [Desulfovibrio sp. TomC]
MHTHQGQTTGSGEAGSVVVFSALIMVVLAAFATLAVDYGFLQYKRSQLQTAADAAALAGAADLLRHGDNFAAVRNTAADYGQRNLSDQDSAASAVTASDVELLKGATPAAGETPDTVRVSAGRTGQRGNPVDMFLGPILGWDTQDLTATASASVFCSEQTKCLKPFSPPAKFTWNDDCDSNNKYKSNGAFDPASSCELASVKVLGYSAGDLGAQITLKLSDSHDTVVPGHFQAVDYPPANTGDPESGAATYRLNIAGCTASNNTVVKDGDELAIEPGNMVGPTSQGLAELIDADPGASWDSATNSVVGSAYPDPMKSPRVALIPFYDPSRPQNSGRNSIYIYQLGAVFIENTNAKGEVVGRFMRGMAVEPKRTAGVCDTASVSLYGVGLVK